MESALSRVSPRLLELQADWHKSRKNVAITEALLSALYPEPTLLWEQDIHPRFVAMSPRNRIGRGNIEGLVDRIE